MAGGPGRSSLQGRFLHNVGKSFVVKPLSRGHALLYRWTGGRFLPKFFGAPVLTIEVRGRKSGKLIRTPVIYHEVDGGWVVVASNGGNPRKPQWARNLEAAEEANVVIRGESTRVRPRFLEGEERQRIEREYKAQTYRTLDDYESFTEREFPFILLERKTSPGPVRRSSDD